MGIITRNFANNILSGGTIDATDGIDGVIPSSNITNSSLSSITAVPAAVGDTIESTASDPSPLTEGQFFYNSTSGVLKGLVQIKAWSAGSNLSTARRGGANMGTQTAAAIAGGQAAPAYVNNTEEYSGYTWSAGGNLNTTRAFLAGAGTQTTGI